MHVAKYVTGFHRVTVAHATLWSSLFYFSEQHADAFHLISPEMIPLSSPNCGSSFIVLIQTWPCVILQSGYKGSF